MSTPTPAELLARIPHEIRIARRMVFWLIVFGEFKAVQRWRRHLKFLHALRRLLERCNPSLTIAAEHKDS